MGSRTSAASIPPHMVALIPKADRKALGIMTNEEAFAKAEGRGERKLQKQAEGFLTLHGYWPRENEWIARGTPPSGWWLHLSDGRRQPIIADLLILANSGKWIEIELKIPGAIIRPVQKQLGLTICRSLTEFIAEVEAWQGRKDAPGLQPCHDRPSNRVENAVEEK